MAEQIARDPNNASVLQNAVGGVNSVLNSTVNGQAANTLSSIQNSTNPTDSIAAMIASGQSGKAPGQYNQNYSNPALSQASGYGNYTNAAGGLQAAQANNLASTNNPAMDYLKQTASGANIR